MESTNSGAWPFVDSAQATGWERKGGKVLEIAWDTKQDGFVRDLCRCDDMVEQTGSPRKSTPQAKRGEGAAVLAYFGG